MDKTESQITTIQNQTAQQVELKLKQSFKRIKSTWETQNKAIKKIEDKIIKLEEELDTLKEERELLEMDMSGIDETYRKFCKETDIEFDLK